MADTPRVTVPVEPTEAIKRVRAYVSHAEELEQGAILVSTSDLKALISAAPAPEGGAVRYRHKKRGTEYTLIGVGRAQGELQDDDPVVLYRGDDGVRLIEAHGGIRRPAGKTARDLLNDMPDEIAATALMQAHSAITYMAECFGKLERPQ
ncbi:hypothetical protein ACIGFJ_06760 [Brevundimonas diminuta]|uniref:hypothetical protein n=1 Tax=Brevundimonas diminuta TaxID=293 RepID=UPI0037CBC662